LPGIRPTIQIINPFKTVLLQEDDCTQTSGAGMTDHHDILIFGQLVQLARELIQRDECTVLKMILVVFFLGAHIQQKSTLLDLGLRLSRGEGGYPSILGSEQEDPKAYDKQGSQSHLQPGQVTLASPALSGRN
jgi:hypothetical protein